jgi:hypothetical protein
MSKNTKHKNYKKFKTFGRTKKLEDIRRNLGYHENNQDITDMKYLVLRDDIANRDDAISINISN